MWQLLSNVAWQVTVGVLSLMIGAETANAWCFGQDQVLGTPVVTPRLGTTPRIDASTPRTSVLRLPDSDDLTIAKQEEH